MKTNILKMIVVGSALLIGTSCGRPEAKTEEGRKLDKPEMDAAGLYLGEDVSENTFAGSIVVWNPTVSADGIAAVGRASANLIDTGVRQLAYLKKEIKPIADEFYPKAEKALGLKAQVKATFLSAMTSAGTWFIFPGDKKKKQPPSGAFVDALKVIKIAIAQEGDVTDSKENSQLIGGYCTAKIWERALDAQFAGEQYKGSRPTPSALCEGIFLPRVVEGEIYEGMLDREQAVCANSDSYKSYFDCYYELGVKKTPFWYAYKGSEVETFLEELAKSGHLQQAILSGQGRKLMAMNGEFEWTDPETGETKKVDVTRVGSITAPKDVIERFEDPAFGNDMPASTYNKLNFFGLVKPKLTGDLSEEEIALRTRKAESVNNIIRAENTKLRTAMAAFSTARTVDGEPRYAGDAIFNLGFQKPSRLAGQIKASTQTLNFGYVAQHKDFGKLLATMQTIPPLVKEAETVIPELEALGARLKVAAAPVDKNASCSQKVADADLEKVHGGLACQYAERSKIALATVAPKTSTQAVWAGAFSFKKSADGELMYLQVKPNLYTAQKAVTVCFPLAEDKASLCDKVNAANNVDAELLGDSSTFVVEFDLDNALGLGLGLSAREAMSLTYKGFNDLKPSFLEGKRLRIEAGINNIDDLLLTLIGDIKVLDADGSAVAIASLKAKEILPPMQKVAEDLKKAFCSLDPSACSK